MPANVIPDLPPLSVMGKHPRLYVITYRNVFDKDLKCAVKTGIKTVGKFISSDGSRLRGEVKFHDDFIDAHPGLDNFKVFKKGKGARAWEFVPEDEDGLTPQKAVEVKKLHAGAVWALDQVVAESPLAAALRQTFSRYHMDRKLLSAAYYMVLEEATALCDYEEFAECTKLPWPRPLTPGAMSRLCSSVEQKDLDTFISKLSEEYQRLHPDPEGIRKVALDSTSISTYSAKLPAAEFGHNKDGDDLRQINVMFVTEEKTGIPLFWKEYSGNVPDSKTVRDLIAEHSRLGLGHDLVLVADKGYISQSNVDDCLRNGFGFVFNTKTNQEGGFVRDSIDTNSAALHDLNNYNGFIRQYVVTDEMDWRYGEHPVQNKKASKKGVCKLFLHLYFDQEISDSRRDLIIGNVTAVRDALATGRKLTASEQQFVDEYMVKAKDGSETYTVDNSKVDAAVKYSGYMALLTDTVKDPIQCWLDYKNRNCVEEAFRVLKSGLNFKRTQAAKPGSFKGRLLIEVIATSIKIMLTQRLKANNQALNGKKNAGCRLIWDSTHKVLRKLNNIMVTRFQGGWYFDPTAGYVNDLFLALGVKPPVSGEGDDIWDSASDDVLAGDDDEPETVEDLLHDSEIL